MRTVVAPSRRLQNAPKSLQPQQLLRCGMHGVDVQRAVRSRLRMTVSRRRSGSASSRLVGQAVEVAALQRREPGVEAVGGDRHRPHADVGREYAAQPAQRRLLGRARGPTGQRRPGGRVRVEVGDLAARVDAGIGPPGHREPHRLVGPQDGGQGGRQLALDGAQSRLGGPAGEVGAVVAEVEPDPQRRSRPLPLLLVHAASLATRAAARPAPDRAVCQSGRVSERRTAPPPTAADLRPAPRSAIAAAFAVQGLLFISLTTRLPRFQDRWDLSELFVSGLLLMVVLLAGAGSALAELAATRGGQRRTSCGPAFALHAVGLAAVAVAPQRAVFVAGLAVYGLGLGRRRRRLQHAGGGRGAPLGPHHPAVLPRRLDRGRHRRDASSRSP